MLLYSYSAGICNSFKKLSKSLIFAFTFAALDKRVPYNQLTVVFILSAFLVQTFNRNIIVIDYYANMQSYASHCENKAIPMMHCNGKCQMMKKMHQEEKKDQENPERRSENKNEIPLSSRSFFATIHAHPIAQYNSAKIYPFTIGLPVDRAPDIFHPPSI